MRSSDIVKGVMPEVILSSLRPIVSVLVNMTPTSAPWTHVTTRRLQEAVCPVLPASSLSAMDNTYYGGYHADLSSASDENSPF